MRLSRKSSGLPIAPTLIVAKGDRLRAILLALGAVLLFTLLRWFLLVELHFALSFYLAYLPIITLIALLLGLVPALLATALAASVVAEAIFSAGRSSTRHDDLVSLLASTFAAVIFAFAAEMVRKSLLAVSDARYRAAFETSPDILVLSRLRDGIYIDVNPRFTEVTGFTPEETLGKTSLDLNIFVDYHDRERMAEAIRAQQPFRDQELQFRAKDGHLFWAMLSCVYIVVEREPCLFITVRDISQVKRAEAEIHYLSYYDAVTGLANRRLLLEKFEQNRGVGSSRALLFLDLDNFKTVNDARGHAFGDLVLAEVARRLRSAVRESTTIARLGGDEFVLLVESLSENRETAATEAAEVATRVRQALATPYLLEGFEFRGACSIGITVFGSEQRDFQQLLQQADIAMYQAKSAGRNAARFWAPELQASVIARATLEQEMRSGIEAGEFRLYYQPQVECGSLQKADHLQGAEALLRWQHPTRGLLAPDAFIKLAEETRIIIPLGNWVIREACRQIAAWQARAGSEPVQVAINISALQFMRDDFVDTVLAALRETGAEPQLLKLELTESILIEDTAVVLERMAALIEHGIHLSLDDFGTGYSCLAYLRRLPLVQLKIDRSFVRDILTDPSSRAITRTIIELSRTLGLPVIAEGVETAEQREALASLGCYSYQGFLFSPPVPAEEFEQMMMA